jgi:NACalpha-BTF3-like transcription factor
MSNITNTYKVTAVMQITGCNEQTATAYLEAEEWDVADAVLSYKADNA